jgi:2-C-methyl-D-erythritol 4-phosphate cytidylyltransferase
VRANFSKKLINKIIKNMKNSKAVIPSIKIQDAVKRKFDSGKYEYIVSKNRDDLFLTQTPQAFNLKQIYNLHKNSNKKYRDDDVSLFVDLDKKEKKIILK